MLADGSCGSSPEHRLQTRRRKTRETPPENLRDPIWGISTVGSARHSHCRGQGFDSPMLHQKPCRSKPARFFRVIFQLIRVCRSCMVTLGEIPQWFPFALCGPGTGLRIKTPTSSSGRTRAFSGADLAFLCPFVHCVFFRVILSHHHRSSKNVAASSATWVIQARGN